MCYAAKVNNEKGLSEVLGFSFRLRLRRPEVTYWTNRLPIPSGYHLKIKRKNEIRYIDRLYSVTLTLIMQQLITVRVLRNIVLYMIFCFVTIYD